jgi:hypothetical protein
MHTKFHKDWFGRSKVNRGDTHTYTYGWRDLINLLYFFKIRKVS